MAEPVGVDLAHPSPHPVTGEHHVHVMIAKGSAVYGLEEVTFAPAAAVVEVGSEGSEGYLAYRRPALLTSLALKDAHTASRHTCRGRRASWQHAARQGQHHSRLGWTSRATAVGSVSLHLCIHVKLCKCTDQLLRVVDAPSHRSLV